jgi:DNA mismatch repair protein MSH5
MPPRFKRGRQTPSSYSQQSISPPKARPRKHPRLSQQPSRAQWPTADHETHADARRSTRQQYCSSQTASHLAAEDEDSGDAVNEVVMAIDRNQRGTIGCAYYVAREERLYCLQDVVNGHADSVEICELSQNPRRESLPWLTIPTSEDGCRAHYGPDFSQSGPRRQSK